MGRSRSYVVLGKGAKKYCKNRLFYGQTPPSGQASAYRILITCPLK